MRRLRASGLSGFGGTRRFTAFAALLVHAVPFMLAACGVTTPPGDEARFTGDVSPVGACGTASHGTLTLLGGKVAFTPTDGVIILRGDMAANGTIKAEFSTIGADKKPYVMTLAARRDGEHVSGTYTTPTCSFAVSLAQVHYRLF